MAVPRRQYNLLSRQLLVRDLTQQMTNAVQPGCLHAAPNKLWQGEKMYMHACKHASFLPFPVMANKLSELCLRIGAPPFLLNKP